MDLTGLGSVAKLAGKVIDRVIPDPTAAAEAKLKLLALDQAGEFKALDVETERAGQQTAINVEDAKSGNMFAAGWRPAVGWVCAAALFAQFIGAPLLVWFASVVHVPLPPPPPDWAQLTPILMGMLGLGYLRTSEKKAGVA